MTEDNTKRLGPILRAAREERGLTPAACEVKLKIKEEFLLALENGHYYRLPTATHARGFLRSYATLLGLGDQLPELQRLFAIETAALPATPHLAMPQPLPEARLPAPAVALGGIAGAVLLYVMYGALQPPPPAPVVQPVMAVPAPVALSVAPVEVETPPLSPPLPLPPPPPPPSTDKTAKGIEVRLLQDSWLQVQDATGATIFSRLMRKGESYTPPDLPGLTLTAGNGAGVVIVQGGHEGKPLGAPAEVVRGVRLTAKKN